MKLVPLDIDGAFLIEIEAIADERGFFARTFCKKEFAEHGLDSEIAQCNVSRNTRRGILRGMHYQTPPHAEAKLVRCTSGAIHDVVVDLRPGSKTYLKWSAVELTAENHRALYLPKGTAHGFLTLSEQSEVFYQMSAYFSPDHARGLRWNDPAIGIAWPLRAAGVDSPILSAKDADYADLVL